jgi:phosphatidate cytidylyltransferase
MMSTVVDVALVRLVGGVFVLLILASALGWLMHRHFGNGPNRAMSENINARIRAWWAMAAIFAISMLTGPIGSIVLFSLISFLAMREFVTLAPTRRADHRALLWCFFAVMPLEYGLIWVGWYGLFSILIPVYICTFLAIRSVLAGDVERFLERTATMQWGVMICVYFVSYVPALLMLHIPGYERQNAKLVFFLVLVVELSDVLQYVWGKTIGRRRIAPSISPNKTWAGFVGGTLSATVIGASIWWATPFGPATAALLAFIATVTGFAGGLVMSGIKRDRGVKDYGSLIEGHGGVLDRIDSLCFAAPVFFHLTRYFFAG